jgi:hypothetical protein
MSSVPIVVLPEITEFPFKILSIPKETVVNSAITVSGGASDNSGLLFNNAGSIIIRGNTVSVSGTRAYGIHPTGAPGQRQSAP